VTKPCQYGDKNKECIVLLDTGTKYSIIRNIIASGYNALLLPWNSSYEDIVRYNPVGVIISNGPGDPRVCKGTIQTATRLIDSSTPTLGICLGNQILALAAGAETFKLKFGHRAQNKPCRELNNGQTYMTSQNHGYGIDPDSLKGTGFKIWFSNIDDATVEGIEHEEKPIIAVQFHPEASPGPYDCIFVFDRFKELIIKNNIKIMEGKNSCERENSMKNVRRKIG
jgi:carbamoyl-phosphate synthase small subunit